MYGIELVYIKLIGLSSLSQVSESERAVNEVDGRVGERDEAASAFASGVGPAASCPCGPDDDREPEGLSADSAD